ncbi:MAG: membrane dipeptidase [Acidobacteriaceae bacterium]|nr:membrane dipeptidase [Acidobacteriaceae bacterium]
MRFVEPAPTRRAILLQFLATAGAIRAFAQPAKQLSTRAIDLVRESLVIDMLNQFFYRIDRQQKFREWMTRPGSFTEADFRAYKDCGVNVFNFGHAATGLDPYEQAIRLLADWSSFLAAYPDWLMRISGPADFMRAKQAGRLGLLFGFQNANHFRTADDVDTFYGLGQRISQLTYNFRNMIGNGAFERTDSGLSEFGVQIVERMNKIGMAVDVAHAGDRTQLDAFQMSRKPVIISHGNARALNNGHPRCVSDESIRAMAKSGGVMGINFISFMVKQHEPVSVDDVVDHFDYVSKLVGIEHVGVGSDFGLESNNYLAPAELSKFLTLADKRYRVHRVEAVVPLQGPDRMYVLTDALIRRGYSDANIRLILGENFRRALTEAWS